MSLLTNIISNSALPTQPVVDTGDHPSVTRKDFVAAMRDVGSSVTVVTTDGPAGKHGATVSAFSSLSADPPTVFVCLRTESRIGKMVRENGCFTVSVLPQNKAPVARMFSGEVKPIQEDRFAGIDLVQYADAPPGIRGATVFACRILRAEVQHSHTIFIGDVLHTASSGAPPLLYHDGAYRHLGQSPSALS